VHSSVGASWWERDARLVWYCECLDNEAGRTHPARQQGIYRAGGDEPPKSLSDVTTGGNEKESLLTC